MNITVDVIFIINLLMIFCRVSSFFLLNPLFAVAQVPVRIRVLLFLALSFCFTLTLVSDPTYMGGLSVPVIVVMMLKEVFVGVVMAFGVFAAFGAMLLGGRILDFQMGFGVASLIDPSTNQQGPLLGTLLNVLAVMIFFLVDGHLLLIESIGYSLDMQPPGAPMFSLDLPLVLKQFGLMFVFGLAMVSPVVFTLLLMDVGMAVAARTMPQVNMFIVSLPLKILVGLMVLALSIPVIRTVFDRLYQEMFVFIDYLFSP